MLQTFGHELETLYLRNISISFLSNDSNLYLEKFKNMINLKKLYFYNLRIDQVIFKLNAIETNEINFS